MTHLREDGMMGGAPTNNTGSTSSYAGFSSKAPAKGPTAGFDRITKKKKRVEEENLDNITIQSRKRFKNKAVPKPDQKTDIESEYTKYTESKTFSKFMEQCVKVVKKDLNEDVFDKIYKISNGRFPERVMFMDRTIAHVDPLTASFIIKTIESLDPQLQKIFREMMNRNIIGFMNVLMSMKERKK